jgi:hypothetical protein
VTILPRPAISRRGPFGPALSEHGREYIEVADVPGWQDYDFPELRKRG